MCTLALWLSVFEDAPLVVAANRDERLDRPSSGPARRRGLIAPKDELAGGTWWAIGESGLFVGLTNRAGAFVDEHRRSRGALVEEIARSSSLEEARTRLEALSGTEYNGFHLLVSDGQAGILCVGDGFSRRLQPLGPGLHLVTERSHGAMPTRRDEFVRSLLEPVATRPLDLRGLARLLSTHDEGRTIDGLCVHWDEQGYGTRSAAVLSLGGSKESLLYAEGPPCVTAFEDLSSLLGPAPGNAHG